MPCYYNSTGNNGTTPVYNGSGACVSPNDFDKYCNYSTNKPFSNIPGPPSDSKIKAYWKRGDVKAPGKISLTWNQYLSYQSIPKGSRMITKRGNIPNGNSYTGKGNGLNNPINLSCGKISKLYGGNSSKKNGRWTA